LVTKDPMEKKNYSVKAATTLFRAKSKKASPARASFCRRKSFGWERKKKGDSGKTRRTYGALERTGRNPPKGGGREKIDGARGKEIMFKCLAKGRRNKDPWHSTG